MRYQKPGLGCLRSSDLCTSFRSIWSKNHGLLLQVQGDKICVATSDTKLGGDKASCNKVKTDAIEAGDGPPIMNMGGKFGSKSGM